ATNGTGCTSQTATANVTSVAPPTASIFYFGNPFCSTNTSTISPTRTGQSGGTYFATPAGLNINTGNGSIKPKFSTPGTYTVTYTFSNGPCTNTTTTTVHIVNCAAPTTTINLKTTNQIPELVINVRPVPTTTNFTLTLKSTSQKE